jgi:hypothetical protein
MESSKDGRQKYAKAYKHIKLACDLFQIYEDLRHAHRLNAENSRELNARIQDEVDKGKSALNQAARAQSSDDGREDSPFSPIGYVTPVRPPSGGMRRPYPVNNNNGQNQNGNNRNKEGQILGAGGQPPPDENEWKNRPADITEIDPQSGDIICTWYRPGGLKPIVIRRPRPGGPEDISNFVPVWILNPGPAPQLPDRSKKDDKTSGILRCSKGDIPFTSGVEGPGNDMPDKTPGFDIVTKTHVEGHAAAYMRSNNIKYAVLYINNPEICTSCFTNLHYALPTGAIVMVVTSDGKGHLFFGEKRGYRP